MVVLKEIENRSVWEAFLTGSDVPLTPFFQSWDWGEIQKEIGNPIFRLGLYKNDQLIGICLCVEIKAKRGHYLHLRHGPVFLDFQRYFDHFISEITIFGKSLGVEFIRFSPLVLESQIDTDFFTSRKLRNAPIHNMDAENAWVLSLEQSEEDLLKNMRKTTRYLVRKAQSLPIKIKKGVDEKDFGAFMQLYNETSMRHGFVPHKGIEKEFQIYGKSGTVKLYLAEFEEKVIAGALIVSYGNQAVYHHGASADEYKHIPATYLLQWQAIQDAKKDGRSYYNFWGVVPENKPKHPWQGLSLFKMGFGGERINFVHAKDLPLTMKYWKAYFIETAWRIKRGY